MVFNFQQLVYIIENNSNIKRSHTCSSALTLYGVGEVLGFTIGIILGGLSFGVVFALTTLVGIDYLDRQSIKEERYDLIRRLKTRCVSRRQQRHLVGIVQGTVGSLEFKDVVDFANTVNGGDHIYRVVEMFMISAPKQHKLWNEISIEDEEWL